MHTEFDDTVKQVQMFYRSGMRDFRIVLLSYAPNFRHFLHRQGVFHAPYWSCFDSIQEVERRKAVVFSFHNLDWPENIEFVYTPFVVVAYLENTKYAEINFGEAGNPIEVSVFRQGVLSRRNIYDDRGFVSSTEIYDHGQLEYTDYLTEKGITKLRVYAATGAVEISELTNTFKVFRWDGRVETKTFKKQFYSSLSEVIIEVLHAHIEVSTSQDIYCVAMHELNEGIIRCFEDKHKYILSFYGDRFRIKDHLEAKDVVEKAGYIITDSEATTRYLLREMGKEIVNVTDISPYDSRMDFGISESITVQKILVPIDGIPEDRFKLLIKAMADYIPQNENAMIHIFTRRADFDLPDKLLAKIADIVEEAGYDRRIVIPEEDDDTAENEDIETADKEEIPVRFFIEQCVDELSVSKCIREQRILVDMQHNPDLFLQINCISAAIPQIVRRETQYMQNGYNGFVVREFDHLPYAVDYFLGSLGNWNQAKVYSYDISKKYTSRNLMAKWKKVIASVDGTEEEKLES